MSANQLVHPYQYLNPGVPLSLEDFPGKPRPHACARCIYMGGEGHSLRELLSLARREQEIPDEQPVQPFRRACAYWSARNRERCGSTKQVNVFGTIGARCAAHDPAATNARYWALTDLINAA